MKLQREQHIHGEIAMIELVERELAALGYAKSDLRRNSFLGAEIKADLLVIDAAGTLPSCVFEFKFTNNRSIKRRAIPQLQTQIAAFSTRQNLVGFLVTGAPADMLLLHNLDITRVVSQGGEWLTTSVVDFSSLKVTTAAESFPARIPAPQFSGHLSEQRSRLFTIARRAVGTFEELNGKHGKLPFNEYSQYQAGVLLAQMDFVYRQLSGRFCNLGIPAPWKDARALFQGLLSFCRRLSEILVTMSKLADEEFTANGTAETQAAFAGFRPAVQRVYDEVLGLLLEKAITKELEFSQEQIRTFIALGQLPAELTKRSDRHKSSVGVVVVCALDSPEFEELNRIVIDSQFETVFEVCNSAIVKRGFFVSADKSCKVPVVIATNAHMGMAEAAVLTTKLIAFYKPKYLMMVGIAAGIERGDAMRIGDVLIPEYTYDLDLGKKKFDNVSTIFLPRILQRNISDLFKHFHLVRQAKSDKALLARIQAAWVEREPDSIFDVAPRIHIGPFGSAGSVIESAEHVAGLRLVNRDLIGFDMEAHGVAVAAAESGFAEVKPLIMKGVCDFGDSDKQSNKDARQRFAAFTSAQFAREFILGHLVGHDSNLAGAE